MVQLPEVHPRTIRPIERSPRAQNTDAKSRGTRDNAVRLRHVELARLSIRHSASSPPQVLAALVGESTIAPTTRCYVLMLSLKPRPFVHHSSIYRRPDSHTCFSLFPFCFFGDVALSEYFCTIAICSLYGEYIVRFFLPGGVFLPCDHGLDFFTSAHVIIQLKNRQTGYSGILNKIDSPYPEYPRILSI